MARGQTESCDPPGQLSVALSEFEAMPLLLQGDCDVRSRVSPTKLDRDVDGDARTMYPCHCFLTFSAVSGGQQGRSVISTAGPFASRCSAMRSPCKGLIVARGGVYIWLKGGGLYEPGRVQGMYSKQEVDFSGVLAKHSELDSRSESRTQ